MRLEIDAGNTWVKWRICDEKEVVERGKILTSEVAKGHFSALPDGFGVQRVLISSVAGDPVNTQLTRVVAGIADVPQQWASVQAHQAGVRCGYQDVGRLGVDRWLAVLAGYQRAKNGVIVVDAGSAITVDVVNRDGAHLGGYIFPGLGLMCDALYKGTSDVKAHSDWAMSSLLPGVTTEQAVERGCLAAAVAAVEMICADHEGELLLTGGDAPILRKHISRPSTWLPDLVFEGLTINLDVAH